MKLIKFDCETARRCIRDADRVVRAYAAGEHPHSSTIERAREADILSVAERLGTKLKKIALSEWAGPCLRAGARDGFSANARKKVFNCRRCAIGGDAIAMVEHITGPSFVEAVKFIIGKTAANAGEEVENHRNEPKGEAEPNRDAFVAKRIAAIVRELVPVRGSPGELCLREARAIHTDLIADILERIDAISGTGLRAASEATAGWRAAGRETHVYLREVLGDFSDALLETGR
jgi:CHC2-type zinc finger protein